MNSKDIFIGLEKQYKNKRMLIVDPKSEPAIRRLNIHMFGYIGRSKVDHRLIASFGNGGKNRKIHAERE